MSGIMGRAPVGNEPPPAPRQVAIGQVPQMKVAIATLAMAIICAAVLAMVAGNTLLVVLVALALLLALTVGVGTLLRASKLRSLLASGLPTVAAPAAASDASVGGRKAISYSYSVGDMNYSGAGTVSGDVLGRGPGAGFWVIYDAAEPSRSAPWNG